MRQSKLSRPILLYRCFVTTLNYWFKGSVFEKWRRVYRLTPKNVWWWFLLILLLFFLIRELLLYAFIPALLRGFLKMKTTFSYFQRMFENRWCIFGPTPIPSTAHPTYEHVVLTAVVGPMHCRSDGHVKNSILVHPTYFKLSHGHVSRSDGPLS